MNSSNFAPDFEGLLQLLKGICQTGIDIVERMNIFFSIMSPKIMRDAVTSLKEEWQQKCGRANRRTLNPLAKGQLCFLDEKFMEMAMSLNLFYGAKLLDIRKSKQYKLHCPFCLRFVSNYKGGLKYHKNACPNNFNSHLMPRKRRRQRIQLLKKALKKQGIAYDDKISLQNMSQDKGIQDQPQTILQREIKKLPTYRLGQKYYQNGGRFIVHEYYIGSKNFDFLNNEMVVIAQEDDNQKYNEEIMNTVEVRVEEQQLISIEVEKEQLSKKQRIKQKGTENAGQLSRANHHSHPIILQKNMREIHKDQAKAKKEQVFSVYPQQIKNQESRVQREIIPQRQSNQQNILIIPKKI